MHEIRNEVTLTFTIQGHVISTTTVPRPWGVLELDQIRDEFRCALERFHGPKSCDLQRRMAKLAEKLRADLEEAKRVMRVHAGTALLAVPRRPELEVTRRPSTRAPRPPVAWSARMQAFRSRTKSRKPGPARLGLAV